MRESMVDAAYEVILEVGEKIAFNDMLKLIAKRLELGEDVLMEKASQLYTSLLRDGRFITLGENVWDLRKKHKYDAVHIDMNEIYHYDEDEESDEKEKDKDSDEEDGYDELYGEDEYNNESDSELEDKDDVDEEKLDGFAVKDIDELKEEDEELEGEAKEWD